jgi:hypothetical protein
MGVFDNGSTGVGIASSTAVLASMGASPLQAALMYPAGTIYVNNVNSGTSVGLRSVGDVVGVALDVGGRLFWFRPQTGATAGLWNGSAANNPATGVGGLNVSALTGSLYAAFGGISGESMTVNFGATGYAGTAPSGFGNVT